MKTTDSTIFDVRSGSFMDSNSPATQTGKGLEEDQGGMGRRHDRVSYLNILLSSMYNEGALSQGNILYE